MSDENKNKKPSSSSENSKRLTSDSQASGTLVQLTGEETDEELEKLAEQMMDQISGTMS